MSKSDHLMVSCLAGVSACLLIPILWHAGVLPFKVTAGTIAASVAGLIVLENFGLVIAEILARYMSFIRRLARFVSTGIFNTIFDASIFNALVYITGIYSGIQIISFSAVSFSMTLVVSYIINRSWSFQSERESLAGEFSQFAVVVTLSLVLNSTLMYILTTVIGPPHGISEPLWVNISKALCAIVSFAWNFTGLHLFVFREKKPLEPVAQ